MARKFAEHPLVVAVAMGLLGPLALPGDEESLPAPSAFTQSMQLEEPDEPDAEEFARIEDLWYQVRTQVH